MSAQDIEVGGIEPRGIEEEMRSSYLEYAMSVIVGRALPDVRDGLKPVHRRVLYAMYEGGMLPNRQYRKCARVVGDVMGNYHPHGDTAIYDTLVRMAQDFSMRHPLVDGQGNFGSIDDDPPAAMRYTEARLTHLAMEMVRDIESDTVDFGPNYDESRREPSILTARFPNLLVNGSSGIAVGMATNIPPHNMGETIDGVLAYIDDPEISVDGLLHYVKGPDFPGGAQIVGKHGIRQAYHTGRGRVVMRAVSHFEEIGGNREAIIVTELPYMVKKLGPGGLVEKIANLVREKRITEISDLRDESDRSGMRIVIELKRGAMGTIVLNKLYEMTTMQQTFGVNMVALVEGVPRTLNLKELIHHYVQHQRVVVTRRTKFELRRAEARAHILRGLLIALGNIDAVIALIRSSSDVDGARHGLIETFDLSREQAQAILDMRLQRLTALESEKLEREHAEMVDRIRKLREILGDEDLLMGLVKDELLEVRGRYASERRTEIVVGESEIDIEDLIAEEDVVVSITRAGYVKRLPLATYRQQKRGGVGVTGMDLKEGDYIEHATICSSHDYVLFFTSTGYVYRLKAYELPKGTRTAKGRAIVNLLPLSDGETVRAVISTRNFDEGRYLVFATRNGLVKKTAFGAYNTPFRSTGIIAIDMREGDELVGVKITGGEDDVVMVSARGDAIRFDEKDARAMGRKSIGVRGMNVAGQSNRVLAMGIATPGADVFVITNRGYGKRTAVSGYTAQRRGGKGVRTIRMTEAKGELVDARVVMEGEDLLLMSRQGMVQRTAVSGIPRLSRHTQGVRVMNIREDDEVSAVCRAEAEEDAEDADVLEAEGEREPEETTKGPAAE